MEGHTVVANLVDTGYYAHWVGIFKMHAQKVEGTRTPNPEVASVRQTVQLLVHGFTFSLLDWDPSLVSYAGYEVCSIG